MSKKAVAGYYRVSQARDGMHAPELYEEEISRYCSFRNLTLAETFSDIDLDSVFGRLAALADLDGNEIQSEVSRLEDIEGSQDHHDSTK